MNIGPEPQQGVLTRMLSDGVTHGDALDWLPKLPSASVDLFFTSPPYADARGYSRIHPDNYVEWFLPFAQAMLAATAEHGSLVLNIKNRVADRGPLKGQRHPYVYELVLAMQEMGWRWIETYIWAKPNAIPGRFGPRTKDSFEYVYHFARGTKPLFNLEGRLVSFPLVRMIASLSALYAVLAAGRVFRDSLGNRPSQLVTTVPVWRWGSASRIRQYEA